ncbi:hypothetical protein F5Y04DRAFT_209918 [Hypomontagnella monticulosa]|nr:hypothetical protein F5Y04DRAFT_209918 [Hypomontagnella monticulosa]
MASALPDQTASQAVGDPATFTLQIVSPSVGIPQPLALQELPTNTTVKQLKERIRNVVNTKPADQAQRLIHRGRLLAREDETMTEIFGQEALRSTEHQTLHLVLRDLSDGRASSTPSPLPTTSQIPTSSQQAAGVHPQQHHPVHHHTNPFQPQPQPQVRIGAPHFFGFPQGHIPGAPVVGQHMTPPPGLTPQQYNHWMRAVNAHMGAHNPNQRAAAQGSSDTSTTNSRGTPGTNTPGRTGSPFQPETTRTTVRESTGPNGLQWRITFNETFINPLQRPGRTGSPLSTADSAASWASQPRSVPSGAQLSNNEVQNILRAADTSSATRVMTDAMRRNASSSSLANLASSQAQHPIPPGVTTPLIPSRAGSATATPDPSRAAGQPRSQPTTINLPQSQSRQNGPEVYILSSPTGPRALLFNSSVETYFSPPARTAIPPAGLSFVPRPFPMLPNTLIPQYMAPTPTTHPQISPVGRGHVASPPAHNTPQPQQQPQVQAQHGLPQPPQAQPQIGHAVARADNPQAQAIRLAQLWPHIWLVTRLGLLIWLFSSPYSSWSRWVIVICAAITVFLAHAGFLNPVVEQFWVPFRRRLENLFPVGHGPHRDGQAAVRDGNARGGNGDLAAEPEHRERELDPADTAARLVQQRRNANANWLMNQARRLERAGILFLASIAPGVAERHIAQVEAEAAAERRRREEAAAAAAAATAEAEQSEQQANAEQNTENSAPVTTNGEGDQNGTAEGERDNERPAAADEPLIVM